MASGTLITFLLQTPRTVKSVQLRGSWDNFGKTYPMERDKRLGSGHWRGCHLFTDIICDGPTVQPSDCRRHGALLQGGQYWYYVGPLAIRGTQLTKQYQLDDDIEVHDVTEPSTTDCPFLPGQRVNVLDVPIQAREPYEPLSSAIEVFTLDPEDKFRAPKPPRPTSFDHDMPRPISRYRSQPSTCFGKLSSIADDIRQKAETLADSASICTEPPMPAARWQFLDHVDRPHTTGSLMWGDCFCSPTIRDSCAEADASLQSRPMTRTGIECSKSEWLADSDKPQLPPSHKTDAIVNDLAGLNISSPENSNTFEIIQMNEDQLVSADRCSLQHTTSVSSARTSGMWSSLTSGSYASDSKRFSRVSQPITPTMSAIGDVVIESALDEHPLELNSVSACEFNNGFLGYSLSEAEYSSVLTIRNLETANSRTSGSGSHPYHDHQRKQYVEAWNDGNGHHNTALQDLVDDLGYLGSIIA